MADVNTYTATPCGPSQGETYEISLASASLVPLSNLATVKVETNPDKWVCCTIDRSTVNQTPEDDVHPAQDSGYALDNCEECDDHWS